MTEVRRIRNPHGRVPFVTAAAWARADCCELRNLGCDLVQTGLDSKHPGTLFVVTNWAIMCDQANKGIHAGIVRRGNKHNV